MTQKYVLGNWKLAPRTQQEATSLATELAKLYDKPCRTVVGVAPSVVHLSSVAPLCKGILVGVQDIARTTDTKGAFTGDVSSAQVADLGATFVLVGHSERRQYHGETDKDFALKINHAFYQGLSVVFCIGETRDEYQRGTTFAVLETQIDMLAQFAKEMPIAPPKAGMLPKLLVAYEPVWAIGTGLTPTLAEITGVHQVIRERLEVLELSAPILYGGSVNPKNAPLFAASPMIDGALVGGASLQASDFIDIVRAFNFE